MNKLSKSILCASLAAAMITSVACGGNPDEWQGTTFTQYGQVIETTLGGFVAETDNYVYFINGVESSSSDNTFGKPVKGALVAAKKSNLAESEVVIPELMVSSDYNAGLYIFGEGEETNAYYGTPNREKDASGEVASNEMVFKKTRLDGKKSETLLTVSSHSTEYRVVKNGDKIYIVYYDAKESALTEYDCTAREKRVICKTDAKVNEPADGVAGEYFSLGEYKFLENGSAAQAVYTVTVYDEPYISEKTGERSVAKYNKMYLYSAGEEPLLIADGKVEDDDADGKTYSVKSVIGEYLFYTETDINGSAETRGGTISSLKDGTAATKIDYDGVIQDGMIIKSLEEVYYYDSAAGKVMVNTLIKTGTVTAANTKAAILNDNTVSSLIKIDKENGLLFCFNSEGYIVAIDYAGNNDGKTIRVSERTASSSWFKPETVALNVGGEEKEYMLYCDNSVKGNSYIYYSDLSDLVAPQEELDDDGEVEYYYLKSSFIGNMPAADRANAVLEEINAINTTLEITVDGQGVASDESVTRARAAYDSLEEDEAAKKLIGESDYQKLLKAEKAVSLGAQFMKLEEAFRSGKLIYDDLDEEQKNAIKGDYDAAKTLVEKLKKEYEEDGYQGIVSRIENNLKYYYQKLGDKLYPAE